MTGWQLVNRMIFCFSSWWSDGGGRREGGREGGREGEGEGKRERERERERDGQCSTTCIPTTVVLGLRINYIFATASWSADGPHWCLFCRLPFSG